MFKLGEYNILIISEKVDFGFYLKENEGDSEKVLLPKKYTNESMKIGDSVEVFIYKDSEDRIIGTTLTPLIKMGEFKKLLVKEVTSIGAFLDWGLEKDLFLPFKEQTIKVQRGNSYLVSLYIDKSGRIACTMDLFKKLEKPKGYKVGDKVNFTIYDKCDEIGYFVAINDKISALVPKREAYGLLYVGLSEKGRVCRVSEDGRVDIAIREKKIDEIKKDKDFIIKLLDKNGGKLYLSDKSKAELIKKETGLSKASFKRAIGGLLKDKKIIIEDYYITLNK